ncbi:MAG: PHP domain-containing protein [Firmicutes bacterium]|nr:PHP domain-containing protein [Bacillota bacterium]
MKLNLDLHIHTYHSPCGRAEMTPADIVRKATERGITRLAITDHFYTFTDRSIFDKIRADVARAKAESNGSPTVYFGCEAEIMAPGRTAAGPEIAEILDFVMAGATHFQNTGITDLPKAKDERSLGEYYLRMFEYAVSIPWVNVIAHPFYVVPGVCSVRILDYIQKDDLIEALKIAKKNDVAMEISRRALGQGQLEFSLWFYEICKEMGLKFTIGSDAHSLEYVGNVQEVRPIIEHLGITEEDIWLPQSKAEKEESSGE